MEKKAPNILDDNFTSCFWILLYNTIKNNKLTLNNHKIVVAISFIGIIFVSQKKEKKNGDVTTSGKDGHRREEGRGLYHEG